MANGRSGIGLQASAFCRQKYLLHWLSSSFGLTRRGTRAMGARRSDPLADLLCRRSIGARADALSSTVPPDPNAAARTVGSGGFPLRPVYPGYCQACAMRTGLILNHSHTSCNCAFAMTPNPDPRPTREAIIADYRSQVIRLNFTSTHLPKALHHCTRRFFFD